jgi:hypothetical protein
VDELAEHPLKVTLVWTDYASALTVLAGQALVNDLDLTMQQSGLTDEFYGEICVF